MESRLQRIVLAIVLMGSCSVLLAEESVTSDGQRTILDDVISPDLERREIDSDEIDSENIEIGFFAGVLAVEDFGSNDLYGARLAYYVTEDIFIETTVGYSKLQETSFEALSGNTQILPEDERELFYYNLSLGLNLFPGELYVYKWAMNFNGYLVAGAGNTVMASNEYFTYHFGGGFRIFPTDWLAMHMDFRNHILSHELFGAEKKIQNLEAHVGWTLFL